MSWAKSPDICEPLQPLLYWLMLLWLVPPACALVGVNGFRGGTDTAKSAYLGGPRFITSSPEHGTNTIIVASAVSGMVRDGVSSGIGAPTRSLSRSSNHFPLTFSRVYLHRARVIAPAGGAAGDGSGGGCGWAAVRSEAGACCSGRWRLLGSSSSAKSPTDAAWMRELGGNGDGGAVYSG